MTWITDVLSKPDQYPDDQVLTYNGQPLGTVKDLRNAVLPKEDMTRATQKSAQERDALQQKLQQTEQVAWQLQQQLQQAVTQRTTQTGQQTTLDELATDQYFGPIVKALKDTQARQERQQQEFEQAKLVFNAKTHLDAIRQVTSGDAEYGTEEAQLKIVQRMRELGTQRADVAYRDLTRDRELTKAREAAKAEGIEEGKKLAKVPPLLAGGRRSSAPPATGPKTLDEVEQAVLGDEEILKMASGLTGEY